MMPEGGAEGWADYRVERVTWYEYTTTRPAPHHTPLEHCHCFLHAPLKFPLYHAQASIRASSLHKTWPSLMPNVYTGDKIPKENHSTGRGSACSASCQLTLGNYLQPATVIEPQSFESEKQSIPYFSRRFRTFIPHFYYIEPYVRAQKPRCF